MPASLLGTTPAFGFLLDEAGIVVDKLDFDFKMEMKKSKNRTGSTQGMSLYDDTCDISLTGGSLATSPLRPRLASALVLANAQPDMFIAATTGGFLLVTNPKLSYASEDFVNLDVKATHYPLISAGSTLIAL
jgi:hypothetical protein